MKTNIKEVNEHINNLNNEVERFRELLHRAIETAETLSSGGSRACRELHHAKKDRHELGEVCPVEGKIENAIRNLVMLKLEARLATAPEEPKNYISKPQQINPVFLYEELAPEEPTTEESSVVQPDPDHIGEANEMVPKWRELGPDEEQVQGEFSSQNPSMYEKCKVCGEEYKLHSGGKWDAFCRRTRRPLPKRERIPPRLDAEIEVVDDPSTYSHVEARHATADAIRYLRSEIETLKKNQK